MLKIDPNIQLSPHFRLYEFLKNGSLEGVTIGVLENLRKLANALEEVRKRCGNKPMTITSGFRTPAHNRAVGGAAKSLHLKGLAADFVVQGQAPNVTQRILTDWYGGLETAPTWTHVDIGPRRRFDYRD